MKDVIESYMEVTSNMASPECFRLWSAISMVSSAMSRRAWTCIEDDLKLFANTFVMLVATPGIGKSRSMDLSRKLLGELPTTAFAGDEVTREEMIQHLGDVFHEKAPEGSKSFLAVVSEFSTFMPKADLAWMQAIARLWDNPDIYVRRTKHMGQDFLHYPYMCMLAGAQPAWFAEGFPANAYELGLPARIFFIYSDQKPEREYFGTRKQLGGLDEVRAGLKEVVAARGEFIWTEEAKAAWNTWVSGGMKPSPIDPLLAGYSVRRDMHLGKLALIAATASHPGIAEIRLADLDRAMGWMFQAEANMPNALQSAGGNTYLLREEAILKFVRARKAATGKAVPEYLVRKSLGKLVPPQMIGQIVDEMLAQKRLVAISGTAPNRLLNPGKEELSALV